MSFWRVLWPCTAVGDPTCMSYNKNTFANCVMTGGLSGDFSQSQTYGTLFWNIPKIPNKEREKRNKKRRRKKGWAGRAGYST